MRLRWVYIPQSADEAFAKHLIDLYPLLTITGERRERLNLSPSWWEYENALTSPDAARIAGANATAGKRIGTRLGAVQSLAVRLFPEAHLVAIPETEDMLAALCSGRVDGLFADLRVLQARLLKGVPRCPQFPLYSAPIPDGNAFLATASTKESASEASRIYREIATLSLDGTISDVAFKWGVFSSYPSRDMKEVVDAEQHAQMLRWGLGGLTVALLALSFQSWRLRRARVAAERSHARAEESQQWFDAFMSHTPAVTFVKDEKGRMVYINEAYSRQFKTSLETLKGKTTAQIWPQEFASQAQTHDREVMDGGGSREYVETMRDPSGELRTFLSLKFPFVNHAGRKFLGGIAVDITDRKRAEEALRFSQFSIDRSPDMVFWIDAKGVIIYANRAACRKLLYDREEFQGLSIQTIDPTLTEQRFRDIRQESKRKGAVTMESVHRTREGRIFPVEVSMNYLEFDGQEFSCSMSRDITERKLAEEELFLHARYDGLTGLVNRRTFENHLDRSVERAREGGEPLTVFYLDLDGFKLVNDTLGHAVGDAMLKQVARRLQSCVRDGDTLARMGGDEFTLICADLRMDEEAVQIARKLLASLKQSFDLAGHELQVTASVGISRFPRDGQDGSALLQNADAAMYEAKHAGKNQFQFFTADMGSAARERLEIEHHLRNATTRGEFELHYQPQVDLVSGGVARYEALLRWSHPALGVVPPSKFIPVAEDTLSIVPIGKWLLEKACVQAREWNRRSASCASIGVNISTVQFARPDFFDTVVAILRKTGLEPQYLELELTESVVMNGLDEFAEKMAQFRALGVKLAIDDFGTGYSSLRYLQKLPFDVMKIDRSFVRYIETDKTSISLVRAMVFLAHSLDMKVVMEGIETAAQLEAVRETGCDFGQGYLLGAPAQADSVSADLCRQPG